MWYTVQHKLNPTQIILGIMAMNEQMNNGRGVSEKHHYAESCPNSNALQCNLVVKIMKDLYNFSILSN